MTKAALLIALAVFTGGFVLVWVRETRKVPGKWQRPSLLDCGIGLLTLFFDTLGIGAFATTTACFKLKGLVTDEEIPGTLNVGIALPAVLEALIYMTVVDVEVYTLTLMMAASVVGAWWGAGIVSKWPRRQIQIGMGITLLVTAMFALLTQLHLLPGGGEFLGLSGGKLVIALITIGILGALMTLGIGFFAPCMMVVYLLGMSPKAAFPIMMGSCAFLGTVGSIRFIQQSRYNFRAALGMTLGGIPGVLLAAYLVRSLPLQAVRWLVIGVVVYTAVMMLRSAALERSRRLEIARVAP